MTSGPTVLWSWRESSPRGFWPVVSQVRGHRERGEKDLEDELRLAFAVTPSSTLKAFSVPPRDEGTLQPLMNFIPLLTFPFPPWSVTLLSPSPRKSERGLLVFGAYRYTDQGSRTMWFLRCSPGVKEGRPELCLVELLWSRQHYRLMGKFHLFMLKFVLCNQSSLSKLWKKTLEFFLLKSK